MCSRTCNGSIYYIHIFWSCGFDSGWFAQKAMQHPLNPVMTDNDIMHTHTHPYIAWNENFGEMLWVVMLFHTHLFVQMKIKMYRGQWAPFNKYRCHDYSKTNEMPKLPNCFVWGDLLFIGSLHPIKYVSLAKRCTAIDAAAVAAASALSVNCIKDE